MRFLVDFHTKIQLHLIRKCTNCYTSKFWKTFSQIGGFFNKYFQVVIETCEFLKADLNLVFLSRTTYTSHWVPQIFWFFFLWCIYLGNLLKLLQKYICGYLSNLFSSLFSPIHPQCTQEEESYFSALLGFHLFSI